MDRALRRPLLVSGVVAFVVAGLGGAATSVGPWYRALEKPWFNPPDWAFAQAWTLIYGLCAVAAALAWRDASPNAGPDAGPDASPDASPDARPDARRGIIGLFAVNIALNIGWSLLFFTLQRPDWALGEIVFFWASIVVLWRYLGRLNRWAGRALLPYVVWVLFASIVNGAIVWLNAPFGQT